MEKYFLAIVPEGKFQEQVTQLKWDIREKFQSKYALKSPAHITVKMPFSYNEAKEEKLVEKFQGFMTGYKPMEMKIAKVRTFGSRVIYLGVEAAQDLVDFQRELKTFCKRELNLVEELSDRNFHPHMTIAFKDIKKTQFQNIFQFATESNLAKALIVNEIVLLKKVDGCWIAHKKLSLSDV